MLATLCILDAMQAAVQYNRDVLPILTDKCLACHGADSSKRKAKLRLDEQESAYAPRDGTCAPLSPVNRKRVP